ncbi:MAG: beta-glucanase (GH16 family) [Maribacter sp.]|jgi:beta-glucanase (GH16 family)
MQHYLILFIFLFCSSIISTAQTIQDDFEGNGTITTWFGDDCQINTNFNNPYQQGINTSATVLEYNDISGQYANVQFTSGINLDLSTKNTFSIKIYVPSSELTGGQDNKVSLKLQDGNLNEPWSTQSEIIKPIALNQWQTITFNFLTDNYTNLNGDSPAPTLRTDFNRVVIQINGEDNNDLVLAYIDDVDFYLSTPNSSDPIFDNLVWADEFDGNGAIDGSKWFHQTQLPLGGNWYNGEIQHYTDRIENTYVDNGSLKLVAKKEVFTDQGYTKEYTSARLNSKFAFQYGKVEVRAKLPTGVGTWPAIWMLGKNIDEDGAYWDNQGFDTTPWPACGEIDIMEHWGGNQNYVQSATHTPSSSGATINHGGQNIPTASNEYHIYTLVWSAEMLRFSVDGIPHFTYNPEVKDASTWPFDDEQYIILNTAIQNSIATNFTESAMDIDYVRVYQEGTVSTTSIENTDQIYFPNPVKDELNIVLNENTEQLIPLQIYSMDGRLVKADLQAATDDRITINQLTDLPSGLYIVSYTVNQKRYSLKMVKE